MNDCHPSGLVAAGSAGWVGSACVPKTFFRKKWQRTLRWILWKDRHSVEFYMNEGIRASVGSWAGFSSMRSNDITHVCIIVCSRMISELRKLS